jgi:hypothetical protein
LILSVGTQHCPLASGLTVCAQESAALFCDDCALDGAAVISTADNTKLQVITVLVVEGMVAFPFSSCCRLLFNAPAPPFVPPPGAGLLHCDRRKPY